MSERPIRGGRVPGERTVRLLVRLMPRHFRERHETDLIECHVDAWRDEEESRRGGAARFRRRTVTATVRTLINQWWLVARRRRADEIEERGMGWDGVLYELRYGVRRLARRPGFSAIVVLTLGLGLGANTAVFSVLESVLVAPLPYEQAEQLVRVYGNYRNRAGESASYYESERYYLSGPAALELRDDVQSLASVALLQNYSAEGVDLTGGERPERVRLLRANAEYFDVLAVTPVVGRAFNRSEETGDSRVAVVREDLWERYLGGRTDAIGRTILMDGEPVTVVGVVSDSVRDPVEGRVDIWVPVDLSNAAAADWDNNYLTAVARIADGVDVPGLRAELDVVEDRHDQISQGAAQKGYTVVPLREDLVGGVEPLLAAVMGAVFFLLLLTCVNVASLMLARAAAREHELAVRTSLGSPRSSLIRHFMVEAGLLSLAGGMAGLVIGMGALDLILSVAPAGLPRREGVALGASGVAFAAAVSVVIGLVLGFATALPFTRPRVERVVSGTRSGAGVASRPRLRAGLVAVEVALAVVLLSGAGVLIRTVQQLQARDLGAEPAGVLTFHVGLPTARYGGVEERYRFNEEFHPRAAAVPGVMSVAATSRLPVTGHYNGWGTRRAHGVDDPFDTPNIQVNQRWIAGDLLETAGLELVAGRFFTSTDEAGAPYKVLINQTLADQLYAGEDPLGSWLVTGGRYSQVVGVVEDEALTFRATAAPMAYHYQRQWFAGGGTMTQMVRVSGDPLDVVPALRAVLAEVDPDLVLFDPRALSDVIGAGIEQERFAATLLAVFAGLAVLLAGLGLYGVLSQHVGRQQHEIGVRIALGADHSGLVALVVRRGLRLALIGVSAGAVLSVALSGALEAFMYEMSARDPLVLALAPIALLGIALFASYLPAVRATRVDPVEAFRSD